MKDNSTYVYVVDDNPTVIQMLRSLMRHEFDLRVRTFNSAEECLEMIGKRPPDLLICDYNLDPYLQNKMNGHALLSRVHKQHPNLPVIMYSSDTNFKIMITLMKKGAIDFVCRDKMFNQRLVESITHALDKIRESRARKQVKRSMAALAVFLACGAIVFYFIHLNFIWYLTLTVGTTILGLLLIRLVVNFKTFREKTMSMRSKFSLRKGKEVKIYVLDDSKVFRIMITNAIHLGRTRFRPYDVTIKVFSSANQCLKEMSKSPPHILMLDYYLEDENDKVKGMNGSKVLKRVKEISPSTEVIMISSNSDLATVSQLLRDGAREYILKDRLWENRLRFSVEKIVRSVRQRRWSRRSKYTPSDQAVGT